MVQGGEVEACSEAAAEGVEGKDGGGGAGGGRA